MIRCNCGQPCFTASIGMSTSDCHSSRFARCRLLETVTPSNCKAALPWMLEPADLPLASRACCRLHHGSLHFTTQVSASSFTLNGCENDWIFLFDDAVHSCMPSSISQRIKSILEKSLGRKSPWHAIRDCAKQSLTLSHLPSKRVNWWDYKGLLFTFFTIRHGGW